MNAKDFILGVGFGLMLFAAAASIVGATTTIVPTISGRSSTMEAAAYACGYVAGQRAIWKAAALSLPVQPPWHSYCDEPKSIAFAHGFTSE